MTTSFQSDLYDYFEVLMSIWFNPETDLLRPNINIKMALSEFSDPLIEHIHYDSPENLNMTIVLDTFKTIQQQRNLGTSTFLITKSLIDRYEEIVARPEIGVNGSGLTVVIITDGEPYLAGSKASRKGLYQDLGIPYNGGNNADDGMVLHLHFIALFRKVYPDAQIVGFSPIALPADFVDATFDNFFYKIDSSSSVLRWSNYMVRDQCMGDNK